jgi:hypothetical protein
VSRPTLIAILVVAAVLLDAVPALACGTCALDNGGVGRTLLLASLIAFPLVAGMIGVATIRRLLRRMKGELDAGGPGS